LALRALDRGPLLALWTLHTHLLTLGPFHTNALLLPRTLRTHALLIPRTLHTNALLSLRPLDLSTLLSLRPIEPRLLPLLALGPFGPCLTLRLFGALLTLRSLLLPLGAIGPLRLCRSQDGQPSHGRG
jgi:hypothetical protein